MKHLFTLAVMASLFLLTRSSYAIPTLTGPTGGLFLPTASVQQGTAISVDQFSDSQYWANTQYPNARALFGVTDSLELGGQFFQAYDDLIIWNVNAKYAIPVNGDQCAVAVGGGYGQQLFSDQFFPQASLGHDWDAYIAGTTMLHGLNLTGTFMYVESVESKASVNLYGIGIEKPFMNGVALGAEFVGGAARDFGNLYLTVPVADGLTARAGYYGIGDKDLGTQLSFGATYEFGM